MLHSSCSDVGDAGLRDFFARGWKEVGVLGSGAQGPVRLVQLAQQDSAVRKSSALKRSTLAEVYALQALARCPHIVELEEHFAAGNGSSTSSTARDSQPCWARLEWLQGGDLRSYVRSCGGQVSQPTTRFIVTEVLRGLDFMHMKGWMHRDIKTENIGLSRSFSADRRQDDDAPGIKLLDFDSAAMVPPGGSLTEVIGTVENMAPEVFSASYDERADCWSLGVVSHQLLFGFRPFNDVSVEGIEEMVGNWRQYLHLPSENADAATEFVRALLTDRADRLSCSEALQHCWIAAMHDRTSASSPSKPPPRQDDLHAQQAEAPAEKAFPETKDPMPSETSPAKVASPARRRCMTMSPLLEPKPGPLTPARPSQTTLEISDASPAVPDAREHEDQLGACLSRIQSLIKDLEMYAEISKNRLACDVETTLTH